MPRLDSRPIASFCAELTLASPGRDTEESQLLPPAPEPDPEPEPDRSRLWTFR